MRPRNATERKLVRYAEALPPVTERQREWAFAHCFQPLAIYSRHTRKVKCLHCGYEMRWDKPFLDSFIDVDEYDCPECGRSMTMQEKDSSTVLTDRRFFVVLTTFRGIQLARTFEVTRDNSRKGKTFYDIAEIYQNWILSDGTEVITGRPHHRSPFSLSFDYTGAYQIKQHNARTTGYYAMDDLFDVTGADFYPVVRVTPLVRRNGWRQELMEYRNSISMVDAMSWLLKYPAAEMMCKTGQLDLFRHMVREADKEFAFLYAVKIANRHKYIVKDASLWIDTLRMARAVGMDTHNPDVVCPPDLQQAHDRILARFVRKQKEEERKSDAEKALAAEKAYRENKGKYFNICIKDDDISVSVIPTVTGILQEGKKMHHCVFDMEYYKKPDSLILSARAKDGRRLETVELSLKDFKVLQSRGVCNSRTPEHDRIVKLVESNADLYRL